MELILIRHGESEGNRSRIYQGWGDCPLSDLGREQAAKVFSILQTTHIDTVISSDSVRAYETARLIFPTAHIDTTSSLRETNCGDLSGLSIEQASAQFGEKCTENPDPCDLRPFSGEHVKDMEVRVRSFVRTLVEEESGTRVAMVTHGGPLKALIAYVLQTDFISICDLITFNNCGISLLQFQLGRWVIKYLNNTAHLI
jgi:broad specificity phosphatase PhoE